MQLCYLKPLLEPDFVCLVDRLMVEADWESREGAVGVWEGNGGGEEVEEAL